MRIAPANSAFAFALVLCSPAYAQSAGAVRPTSTQSGETQPVDGSLNCPVGFTARRQSPTEVVAVDQEARHTTGQGVHLTLQHPPSAIRSAEVTVHAVSSRTRYLPLDTLGIRPDLSKDFHLEASGKGGLHASDLWLDHAGSIRSVDLLSVTYADGSVWKRDRSSACNAPVSGYMLIDSDIQSSRP